MSCETVVNCTEVLDGRVMNSIKPGRKFIKLVHDKIMILLGDDAANLSLKEPYVKSDGVPF